MDPIRLVRYQKLRSAIAEKRYEDAMRISQEMDLMGNLLHHAVYEKDLALVKWVLGKEMDVHCFYRGLTPFMRACQDGELPLAHEILLHDLSQVNERTQGNGIWPNRTALMFAASSGSIQIADLLIANGADINHRDDLGFTAMMAAAAKGHGAMIESLHSRGGNEKYIDVSGRRALNYAVESGSTNAVSRLLSYGLDINEANLRRLSIPLWVAIGQKDVAMVEFLLRNGANPDWQSSFGEDASLYADRVMSTPEIRKLLMDRQSIG